MNTVGVKTALCPVSLYGEKYQVYMKEMWLREAAEELCMEWLRSEVKKGLY